MEGKIFRITYNAVRHQAELHMKDGETRVVPMSNEEWKRMLEGDLMENFNNLLNEK